MDKVEYLLSPKAIRESCLEIFKLAQTGQTHFKVNIEKLDEVCDFVMEVINDNYPDHNIPFHSRWGHFQAGSVDRLSFLADQLKDIDPLEIARIKLDLVVTSVLLDAGAGPAWNYTEESTQKKIGRSEGLAVASFYMFINGAFSSDDNHYKADIEGMKNLTTDTFKRYFQVSDSNPLIGVDGRVNLIKALGETIEKNPEYFPEGRPGSMIDYLQAKHGNSFKVSDILDVVLKGLGGIWPGREQLAGINLGDVWKYSPLDNKYICFHKLSQWLTYSLVTPMIEAGLDVTGAEELTGLAEYRNGGLLLDSGLIELRDESLAIVAHKPSSELIIEWRALTICLLDKIGANIQKRLGKTPAEFPLTKVLEGGTWWAGRRIAQSKREDSSPPLKIDSDGTVF